jgi:hypothetical protein
MVYSQVAEADSEKPEPAADVVPIGKDDFLLNIIFEHCADSLPIGKTF